LEKQETKLKRSSKTLITIGFVAIAVSFLAYWNNENIIVTPAAMPALRHLAVATYAILLLSFGAISLGLYRFYKTKALVSDNSISSIVASAINSKKGRQIFIASFIGYGLFFAFTSGMILYKPELNATDFGFPTPPYAELSPCCGYPGNMPMILAFFTEHVGLQVIPFNLVMLVIVSFLVSTNFALFSKTFTLTRKKGSLGVVGAGTGLFVGCPTCAGTAFFLITGLWGSAAATATTLFLTTYQVQLQTLFLVISIPVLAVTPIIMTRNIRKSQSGSCPINNP
jgi:hypothetical protein